MFKHKLDTHSPRLNAVAIAAATLVALYAYPASAQSQPVQLPQGGTFQRGEGSITSTGNSAQINTTAAPGKVSVINWGGGFNVGAGGKVTFNNGTGANSLNAINVDPTGNTSSINGTIHGTGPGMNILVVNPNGVSLGSGASINTTGAFSAIAGKVDPASIAPGGAGTVNIVLGNAPIIIHAAVAGQSTALGKIEVGADKPISMSAGGPSTLPAVLGSADITIGGAGAVTGSGNVASGGESYRLNTAGSLTFVNASVAASKDVAITGKEVHLSGTNVNATAESASVKIGGGARGKDTSIANSQFTNVDATSSITTGANSSVVVWGDKANFEGSILNPGGNAEISGKQLSYSGKTDLRSAIKTGTLLFDPDDLIIDAAGGTYTAQTFGSTGPSTISGAALSSALQTASIVLEANNSITVQDAITSTTPGSNLSMSTGGLLAIGGKINIRGNFEGKVGALGAVGATAAPEIRMTAGGAVETNGGNIRFFSESPGSAFNATAGTAIVNGVNYQGSLLNAAGGDVNVTLGHIATNGLDIKTTGAGKIDAYANEGALHIAHQKISTAPSVVNISEGGVWSSQRGNLTISSTRDGILEGPTLKTYAGAGETGGNISFYAGRRLAGVASPTGEKPLQIIAGGATDAIKTGDIFYGSSPYFVTYTTGATIYSGPQNDPNGTAGAFNVQPGTITVGPGGWVGNGAYMYDTQISNQVSWGTNTKSAPININGWFLFSTSSGSSTGFSPEPTNGGFFAEGNWYPAGALPTLGKPVTMMSTRPGNYSYTPLVSSGDMALTHLQRGTIIGADSGGKLDITYNPIFPGSVYVSNLKSAGDMNLVVGNQQGTTIGKADSGGKLSITAWYGVKLADELTAAKGISLWNEDMTGNAAYAFQFLPGAKAISTATTGESIALAASNFSTAFDFGGQPLPIIAPGGRWAYYFTDPSSIPAAPLFGPAKTFHRYNCRYGGAPGACANTDAPAIPTSGTAYLYAYSPTLTVNTPTFATTYGTGPDYRANSTLSGYLATDAGIDVVAGTMAVTGGTYSTSGNLQAGTQAVTYGSGLASELGYKFTGPQFTVNVAQKQITQSGGIAGVNKEYDGNTTAALNTAGAVFTGAAVGDLLTASATGTFDNKNAGNNKVVTLAGTSIGGADSANYILTATGNQTTALASISPKMVTINSGLVLDDKVYDGTTQAISNSSAGVISGVLAFDVGAVSVGVVAGNYTDKLVGTNKTATFSSFQLGGAEGANYVVDVAGSQQSATGNITPKVITATSITNADKVYDATTAALGYAVLSGIVAGDSVTGSSAGNFDTKNVGVNKAITYSGVTLGSADASNYVLASSGNAASGVANITPKSITINSGLTVNKVYDGVTAVVANGASAVMSGLIGGDTVSATASGNFTDKNVGTGKTATFSSYSLTGADSGNYMVNTAGSQASAVGDVTPKSVAIASGLTVGKVYDGSSAVVANGAAAIISGLIGGDVVTATASGNFADKNAGTAKNATFASYGLTGSDSSNYVLNTAASQASAVGNITPKSVTIDSGLTVGKVYDGTTAIVANGASAIISGLVGADIIAATASGNFVDKNVGTGKTATFSSYALSGTDSGNYTVNAAGSQASAAGNITPKTVTITSGLTVGKVYDGSTAVVANGASAVIAGLVGTDSAAATASGNFVDKNVGSGKTAMFSSYGLSGTDGANYVVNAAGSQASATGNITPKTIQIASGLTADKIYDGSATAIINGTAAVIAGKVAGDNVSATAAGNFQDKNAGIGKTVVVTGYGVTGTDAGNYVVATSGNQNSIVAKIDPKAVSIGGGSIAGVDKVFDGNTSAQIAVTGATITGQIAGDVLVVNASGAFDNQNVGNNKPVAFSGYGLTGTDAVNYTVVSSMPPALVTSASITPATSLVVPAPVTPVAPITQVTPPANALPRAPGQGSVFGGWMMNPPSESAGLVLASPENGTAGSVVMSSGPLTATGGGPARNELCISEAIALGKKSSDAIKQCSVVVTPQPAR